MSASAIDWPSVTATPLLVGCPPPAACVIVTASRLLAGLSLASLKPKSAAVKV